MSRYEFDPKNIDAVMGSREEAATLLPVVRCEHGEVDPHWIRRFDCDRACNRHGHFCFPDVGVEVDQ